MNAGFTHASCVVACWLAMSPALAGPLREVTLGAEDDAAPWSYANGSGYVNDLVKAALAASGWQVKLQVMPYIRCKARTLAGTLAGCFSASKTQDLADKLLFPKYPVFEAHFILVKNATSPPLDCNTSGWGKGWRIETINGYEYPPQVDYLKQRRDLSILTSNSEILSLRKLNANRIDAAVVTVDQVKRLDLLLGMADIDRSANEIKPVCELGTMPAYVMFSPLHPLGRAALQAFESGYQRMAERGEVQKLQQEWRKRALDLTGIKYQ